ncbi:TPA: hypothetical protein ACITN2_004363 [Salmonella enterica subsp. enterica serovar Virchow]
MRQIQSQRSDTALNRIRTRERTANTKQRLTERYSASPVKF